MNDATRETPLAQEHRKRGARMVPFAGWTMPIQYEGIKAEHLAVRTRAGLFDVSHMGEIELTGPRALEAADRLVTNDVSTLETGRALYTVCCNAQGFILDDLIVYRIGAERVLIVCNASNRDKIVSHVNREAAALCDVADKSDDWALLALQGPLAVEIMRGVGAAEIADSLAYFHVTESRVAGIDAIVARTGYTGEDGFELFCSAREAAALWRALFEVGEPLGLKPIGLGARDTLRLEAKLPLYGNELDESTHPFEAGLGWVVKLEAGDFIGKAALQDIKTRGFPRKLVGFEMTGRGIARHGYPIVVDGNEVGTVTSGSPGPSVGKNIGLGYVPKEQGKLGSTIGIAIRGKVVDAVIVRTPFYRRPA